MARTRWSSRPGQRCADVACIGRVLGERKLPLHIGGDALSMPGCHNDIKVLQRFLLFARLHKRNSRGSSYQANGNIYTMGCITLSSIGKLDFVRGHDMFVSDAHDGRVGWCGQAHPMNYDYVRELIELPQ